jgi:hypothetical protein
MTIASDERQHAQAHAIMLKLMLPLWRLKFGESDKAGSARVETMIEVYKKRLTLSDKRVKR